MDRKLELKFETKIIFWPDNEKECTRYYMSIDKIWTTKIKRKIDVAFNHSWKPLNRDSTLCQVYLEPAVHARGPLSEKEITEILKLPYVVRKVYAPQFWE